MANQHDDFVVGFISMQSVSSAPQHVHMTPGVSLGVSGDTLKQQYKTPLSVIRDKGSDVIIVGRGVYRADDPVTSAKEYQRQGWEAYEERIAS